MPLYLRHHVLAQLSHGLHGRAGPAPGSTGPSACVAAVERREARRNLQWLCRASLAAPTDVGGVHVRLR
jgi:hypothetical protein